MNDIEKRRIDYMNSIIKIGYVIAKKWSGESIEPEIWDSVKDIPIGEIRSISIQKGAKPYDISI